MSIFDSIPSSLIPFFSQSRPHEQDDIAKEHLITSLRTSSDSNLEREKQWEENDDGLVSFRVASTRKSISQRTALLTIVNCVICAASLFFWFQGSNLQRSERQLLKQSSFYSPFFDLIDVRSGLVKLNGTLFDRIPPTIYRQDPSPEVDAAWESLVPLETLVVHGDDVAKLGKDASTAAKYPESFGFGPDAYIAQIDVVHQLHCLNALRMELFYEYYYEAKYGPKFGNGTGPPLGFRIHSSHCIYMLLQNLMCNAHVDVVTYNWIDGQHLPFPDFSIEKKCRNYDVIMEWHRRNSVPVELFKTLKMPEGFVPLDPIPGMGPIVEEAKWF